MIDEAGGSWKVAQPQYSGQSDRVLVPVLVLSTTGHNISLILSTRRYGPIRGPTSSSGGGLRPSAGAFFALRKKNLIMLFWPSFGFL